MKGRVVFLIRLKPGMQDAFLEAYEEIRHLVADGVDGHLLDQVCQSDEDPERWLITSEWKTLEHFRDWESKQEHRDLAKPLRDCMAESVSLKFNVREETGTG
jgi:heme-degrading monooxygenase HmoA